MKKFFIVGIFSVFLLPFALLFNGCDKSTAKVTAIEVSLAQNSNFTLENNTISTTFNNNIVEFEKSNFVVNAKLSDNTSKLLTESEYTLNSTIIANEITNAGNYQLTFGYKKLENVVISVVVNKATINYQNPEWSFSSVKYSGEVQKPILTNLPEGVTAQYVYKQNDEIVEEPISVGTYTASANLICDNNHLITSANVSSFVFEIIKNNSEQPPVVDPPIEKPDDKPDNPPVEEPPIEKPDDKPDNPPVEEPPIEKPDDKPDNPPVEEPDENPNFSKNDLLVAFENLTASKIDELSAKAILLENDKTNDEIDVLINNADFIFSGFANYSGVDFEVNAKINNVFTGTVTNSFNKNLHLISKEKVGNFVIDKFSIKLNSDKNYTDFEFNILLMYLVDLDASYSTIEDIGVTSYNLATETESEEPIIIDSVFEGENEIIVSFVANLKNSYSSCYEVKYFKNLELTKVFDKSDLNINTIYVAVFNNNCIIEVKPVTIKYDFTNGYSSNLNNYDDNLVVETEEDAFVFDGYFNIELMENLSNLEDPENFGFMEEVFDETNHLIIRVNIKLSFERNNTQYTFDKEFIVRSKYLTV